MTARTRFASVLITVLVVFLAPHPASDRIHSRRTLSAAGEPPAVDMGGAPSAYAPDPAARQAGADEGWWQAVRVQLAREEYCATMNSDGLQAPNPAHNLRAYFRERGVEVVPRESGDGAAWRFVWATARFGRPGALREVGDASPEPNGSRVTYRRREFEEWYDNSGEGLEQGFIVHAPPPGAGPLCLAGRLAGSLQAELRPEESVVDLLDAHGTRVLRYGELHVWDAGGHEVPSRLSLEEAELAILIEDRGAAYPLTVDPLMTSPAWTAESDQADASFGISVATAGDVNGDGFSDVIVGAEAYDNGETNEGRAFAYHGSAAGLATTPAWTAESNQVGGLFGNSAATAGDVNGDGFSDVIVGAFLYDNGEILEGAAFAYHGSAAGLATTAAWTAESNQAEAYFGYSVATAGDVNGDGFSDVIVGAYQYDNGESLEGRAFAYYGSAAGLATSPAWTAEGNQTYALFGVAVSTAGDVNGDGFSDVIVGGPGYTNGQGGEGGAFVYQGSAAGLATTPVWTAESDQALARFGLSVGTAGDVNGDGFSDVIVGAVYYDNGESDEGRAFAHHGSAAGLATTPAWTAESNQAHANFGNSVATAGDVNGDGFSDVIVGAGGYDDEGRAFAYHGSAAGLATTPAWTADSNQANAGFGISVATAGDVNGDGFSDVIVGAWLYNNGQGDEGRAFAYHGSTATGIEMVETPGSAALFFEARPNPLAPSTEIGYALPRGGQMRLAIYDVTGCERAVLVDAVQAAGRQAVTWDGRDGRGNPLPAGVYFARLAFEGHVAAQKLVLAP